MPRNDEDDNDKYMIQENKYCISATSCRPYRLQQIYLSF